MLKFLKVVSLHPLAPRWFKVLVLRFIMLYVSVKIKKVTRKLRKEAHHIVKG